MGLSQGGFAAIGLAIPGLLGFFFAIAAENKKPADPTAAPDLVYNPTTDESTCRYHQDETIVLGILAVVFFFISSVLSIISFYFPYNGRRISVSILWKSTTLLVFTIISLIVYFIAETLLLWALIVESTHRIYNVHSGKIAECPTAKSGLFGGAGFLGLDATLFFLIVLMLTYNARTDYLLEEEAGDGKGSYGQVTTYVPAASAPGLQTADRV